MSASITESMFSGASFPKPEWVFAYGSLIWKPGFEPCARRAGVISGYHREFALWSHRYRGTKERPGLVLALVSGGECRGEALKLPDHEACWQNIWQREMIDSSYCPKRVRVQCANDANDTNDANDPEGSEGQILECLTFVLNERHAHAAKGLSLSERASIIAQSSGAYGSNYEYLHETVMCLRQRAMPCTGCEALLAEVERIRSGEISRKIC